MNKHLEVILTYVNHLLNKNIYFHKKNFQRWLELPATWTLALQLLNKNYLHTLTYTLIYICMTQKIKKITTIGILIAQQKHEM